MNKEAKKENTGITKSVNQIIATSKKTTRKLQERNQYEPVFDIWAPYIVYIKLKYHLITLL